MTIDWVPRAEIPEVLQKTSSIPGCHALLFGPPGTGKTSAASLIPGQNAYSITLTPEMPSASFFGHFVQRPTGQGPAFQLVAGPALRAWIEPAILVVNEIDKASEDVHAILHLIADNPAIARQTLMTRLCEIEGVDSEKVAGAEVVDLFGKKIGTLDVNGYIAQPTKGFRLFATMNGNPFEALDEPVLDRFMMFLPVFNLDPAQLDLLQGEYRAVAKKMYDELEAEFQRAMVDYVAAPRPMDSRFELFPEFSYRRILSAQLLGQLYPQERACVLSTGALKMATNLHEKLAAAKVVGR